MKRYGDLFDSIVSKESLYHAWLIASRGKMQKRACFEFSKNVSRNIDDLHNELVSGTYRPRPYVEFQVHEPKQRTIYAPAFRDLVVQHAIYQVILHIFDKTFIDQSFACRLGMGTHKAADYAQQAMRESPNGSYVLKMDIRKFFYRIDRSVLKTLLEKKIKDVRLLSVMMMFADYGKPVGVPIGNLLSQLYALIYLNPLDQYIKRELKAKKYCRYVDDFVIFGWDRESCLTALAKIESFLKDELHLELSKWSLHPINRGLNFVGYRMWRKTRFIRKHSLHKFTRSAKKGNLESVVSILGHSRNTGSFYHLLNKLKENFNDIFNRLPKAHRRSLYKRIAITNGRPRKSIRSGTMHTT